MSWSFSALGTKEAIVKALDDQSTKESGQCKIEFDAALPHLKALVCENFQSDEYKKQYGSTLIDIDVNGSGSAQGGVQTQRSLTINCLRRVYKKVLV